MSHLPNPPLALGSAIPISGCAIFPSVSYDTTKLGFKVNWHYPGQIASVSRDRCGLFLCVGDQGNPGERPDVKQRVLGEHSTRAPS